MADNIVVFDFFGLPGCGKSVCSHEFAKLLVQEGFHVNELTYNMDHRHNIVARFLWKTLYALLFRIRFSKQAQAVNALLRNCLPPDKSSIINQQRRNLLYKLYLIYTSKIQYIIMDEGIAQAAISITTGSEYSSLALYQKLFDYIPKDVIYCPVYLETDIRTSLSNMASRKSNDSRAEKISSVAEKEKFVKQFELKVECLSDISRFTVKNDSSLSPAKTARNLYGKMVKEEISESTDGWFHKEEKLQRGDI